MQTKRIHFSRKIKSFRFNQPDISNFRDVNPRRWGLRWRADWKRFSRRGAEWKDNRLMKKLPGTEKVRKHRRQWWSKSLECEKGWVFFWRAPFNNCDKRYGSLKIKMCWFINLALWYVRISRNCAWVIWRKVLCRLEFISGLWKTDFLMHTILVSSWRIVWEKDPNFLYEQKGCNVTQKEFSKEYVVILHFRVQYLEENDLRVARIFSDKISNFRNIR